MLPRLENFLFKTMSLASEVNNPAIDNLVQSSLPNELGQILKWIPCEEITNMEPTQSDNVYYAIRNNDDVGMTIMLLLLGSDETCTPTLVSEFARIYSLPTHKYKNVDNNFRRYSVWLERRNNWIKGFTKSNDDKYYMVADERFYDYYSRYGFCSACRILRCSPLWCICGHKQLSDGWTSNNRQLDELIKKSQLQTNSANDAYLEWISLDCIDDRGYGALYGLPTYTDVTLTPLGITDKTHDLSYAEVNCLLMRHFIE